MRSKSLRVKVLTLFALAVIVPAAIIAVVTTSLGYRSLWNSVKREQKEIARRVGDTIQFKIDSTKHILQSLAKRDLISLPPQQVTGIFKDVIKLDDSIMEITLVDRRTARDVISIALDSGKRVKTPLSSRRGREEYVKAVYEGVYVSRVFFTGSRIPYIFISAAGAKQVILAKVDVRGIWETISKIRAGKAGYAFIVDSGGMLIAHPATERVIAHADFTSLQVVKEFLSGAKEAHGIYRDEAGDKVISFCYPVKELGWGIFTSLPYNEVVAPVNRMALQAILLAGIFGALFLFVGLKFAGTLMDPLTRLKDAAGRLSKGRYDIEVKVNSGDELEDLAVTFNEMVKSLKELEELRNDLVSMIVHDMKSPLSGIVGSLDYLVTTKKDINEQKEIIEITRKSAENLHGLIQNLLDISKMEDGKLSLDKEEARAQDIAGHLAKQFELTAKNESKEFVFTFDGALPPMKVDRSLIKRVISNLLTNSLHHTAGGGKIWLTVSAVGENAVRFEIGDDGVGIPEEYRTKIFEKFVQVEKKRAHLRTGTGLGLTFCKMAVELHNGKIWVESEEGKGSKFFFEIPI